MSKIKFELYFTKFFRSQVLKLNDKEKKLIKSKLELIKTNPTNFKKLQSYKHVFEVKISIQNNYSRLIYAMYEPNKNSITIFGIFKRKNDFKDFKKFYENYFK